MFLSAQVVFDNSFKTYHQNTEILYDGTIFVTDNYILPITLQQNISGLSISGIATFTGKMGFVRIVFTDIDENDYLVLETNTIFENNTSISFVDFCEETALMNNVLPKQIQIECVDAEITIYEIKYSTDTEYRLSIDKQIKAQQLDAKLQHINSILAQKNKTWGVGKTSLAEMSYMEKKDLFGGKLPNLAGFDYYVSGIYVMQGYESKSDTSQLRNTPQFVSEFDWRNRHGRNWITPIKNQGSCGSCWIFSAVGTTEAYVNLYYNQLLDLDLSEQDILTCGAYGSCSGGSVLGALYYIRDYGIVNESCFPYTANDGYHCNNKCNNPSEKIKISNVTYFGHKNHTSDDLKKLIIKHPMSCDINCWNHSIVLVGFKTIQVGDRIYIKTPTETRWVDIYPGDPLIGCDAWLLKNSWGTDWGEEGFAYVVTIWDEQSECFISGKITSLNYTNTNIICEDKDGDGYYYWGSGQKPASCPCWAPDEPDGDDSNPNLGPMDEYGNCLPIIPLPDIITTTQTWSTNRLIHKNITIQSGVTLTIKGIVKMADNRKITILPGGKLIVDGGTLTSACPDKLWYGILVSGNTNLPQTPQNQGTLELKNGAVIENAKDAISTCALKPNGGIDWDRRGGIIYAENATFKNNKRAAEFLAYKNISGSGKISSNVSYFKNCKFVVDDTGLFTSQNINFIGHITMWGVSGVKITGCTFENNITTMPDRKQAIGTIDAGYIVDENCSLYAISATCPTCQILASPSVFKGFNKAIESSHFENQYAIKIDRSSFLNNITAVKISGHHNFQISRSNMSLYNNYSNSPVGIYLDECSGYKVEGNTIYNSRNSSSPIGIFIDHVGTNENKIYRNTIFNTRYGIKVENTPIINPAPPTRSYPATGLQFICNDFTNNFHDISAPTGGKIRATQGAATAGADNLFKQTGAYNIYLSGILPPPPVSYFYDTSVPAKNPALKYGNITTYPATKNPCSNSFCNDGGGIILIDKSVASLETYRELNQQFSEMMHVFYAKGYDKILDDYYNGIIENEELLQEAITYHEEILTVTEYMSTISNEALFQLKTDSIIDLNQIREWYDAMYNLSAKYSLAETYYQLEKYDEGFRTLYQIPEMYKLNEDEMIEYQNYVSLFTFKNKVRESGRNIAQLNEEEINQLLHFAHASNGLSSVIARGILCFFYEICLDDEVMRGLDDEMINEGGERDEIPRFARNDEVKSPSNIEGMPEGRGSLLESITIYPNPTTGELIIENGELKIENVEIYDVYGRKLSSNHHIITLSHHKIDISHLQSGVYFVKVITDAGEVTKKIVKQ